MIRLKWLEKVPRYTVNIECPQCHNIESATVYMTEPFYMYAHICSKCEYLITESEWNEVENEE